MGLFDIFTGDPVKKAAEQTAAVPYRDLQPDPVRYRCRADPWHRCPPKRTGQCHQRPSGWSSHGSRRYPDYSPQAIAALYGGQTGGTNALLAGQTGGLESLRSGVQGATDAYGGLAGQGQGYDARALQGGDIAQGAFGLGPMAGQVKAAFQV